MHWEIECRNWSKTRRKINIIIQFNGEYIFKCVTKYAEKFTYFLLTNALRHDKIIKTIEARRVKSRRMRTGFVQAASGKGDGAEDNRRRSG